MYVVVRISWVGGRITLQTRAGGRTIPPYAVQKKNKKNHKKEEKAFDIPITTSRVVGLLLSSAIM